MTLDAAFWLRLSGTLAVESALVVGGAWLAQRLVRTGAWKRAVWQMAIVSLVLLTISELSGLGRGLSIALLSKAPVQRARSTQMNWTVSEGPVAPILKGSPKETGNAVMERPPRAIWWPGVVWVLGTAVVVARIAFAQGLLTGLRVRWGRESDPELNQRVSRLGKQLRISRRVCLLRIPGLSSPIAFGWMRPCIGLPADFTTRFNAGQQDTMLAHELGHLAARDPLWYLIADMASACLWWLPFAWLARRHFQWTSELAADEASFIVEDGAGTLAECLVGLAREGAGVRRWAWMGITGSKSNFGQRVERLLERGNGAGGASVIAHGWPFVLGKTALTASIAAALVLGTGWLRGQGTANPGSLQRSVSESWKQSPGAMMVMVFEETGDSAFNPPKPASQTAPPELFSKTWRVDTERLFAALQEIDSELKTEDLAFATSSSWDRFPKVFRKYLSEHGVDIDLPGKSAYINGLGMLLVRGTQEDIEKVDKLMADFPRKMVQMSVVVQYADFDEALAKELGFDWVLGDAANPDPASGWKIGERRAIITDLRRGALVAALRAHSGVKLSDSPKVTTRTGRLTHLSLTGEIIDPHTSKTVQVGRTVDLIGNVLPDMRTLHMGVIPQICEAVLPTNGLSGATEVFSVDLYDSQTVIAAQKGTEDWSVALITVRLIDPVGNAEHRLEDMPFATNSIPNQLPPRVLPKPNTSAPRNTKLASALSTFEAKAREAANAAKAGEGEPPLVFEIFDAQQSVSELALKIFKHKFPEAKEDHTLTNAYNYLSAYLKNSGVQLKTPKLMAVNDRNGRVIVRCTPGEKAVVKEAVLALNRTMPQVKIEARVLEVDAKSNKRATLDAVLRNAGIELTSAPIGQLIEKTEALDLAKVRESQEVTNVFTGKLIGVLSGSQARAAMEALSKRNDANFLAAPTIMATSDREANVASLDFYYPAKLGSTILPPLPEGVTVQFRPHVVDEDRSIELDVTSTATHVVRSKSKPAQVQVRQVSDSRRVEAGQTMVLCGLSDKSSTAGKDLVVFVTPRVIDLTGNQVR